MPTLSFEGETHDEIVRKVRRWLASLEGSSEEHLDLPEAVERASEITKDALTVVAQAAPAPIARSDIFKALTRMGYEATESTKRAVIASLDALDDATEGDVVKRVQKARNSVLYEMNAAVAKQLLRSLRG
ncbi:MAG: hypothetical protein ACLGHT_08775 [Acidimicrobiia bacterium]